MRYTFDELMRLAEEEAGGIDVPTRPTIVKELLHYDILLALSRSQMSQRLVFQGGTALRLCYGGQRYSEDLDFVCGHDATEPFDIAEVESLLREHVADRYGLALEVKPPGEDRQFAGTDVVVKRWSLNVMVPGFAGMQRIHFEVCNVPAYDSAPLLLLPRYAFLSDVYSDIALRVESLNEITADKVVALIGRSHLKARDLWDLRWLAQKGAEPDVELVRAKLDDYGIGDVEPRIASAAGRLQSPAAPDAFAAEMRRFVTPSLGARLLGSAQLCRPWLKHASKTLEDVRVQLANGPSSMSP